MASQDNASSALTTSLRFGAWLRQAREEKDLPQRAVAAAAQMDSSHYGKVESGKRYLTADQVVAVAAFLGLPETDVRRRMLAAQVAESCDGNPTLLAEVAGLLQEASAPYVVNKSANKLRAKK